MRLMILPNGIDLNNVGNTITHDTGIFQITESVGVAYEWDEDGDSTDESNRRVNEWLLHYMDAAPFHKLCYNSSISIKQVNDYLTEHGNDAALTVDPYHDMTPLHMLSMNPHAPPANTIAALLDVNMEVAIRLDSQGKMSLDLTKNYNVGGLVGMINGLCNHRHAAFKCTLKRKRIEQVD